MTIPKGTLFPMCGMNLGFNRELIGPAMYFGLMGDGQPIGRYDDMWAGWCTKVHSPHTINDSLTQVFMMFWRLIRCATPFLDPRCRSSATTWDWEWRPVCHTSGTAKPAIHLWILRRNSRASTGRKSWSRFSNPLSSPRSAPPCKNATSRSRSKWRRSWGGWTTTSSSWPMQWWHGSRHGTSSTPPAASPLPTAPPSRRSWFDSSVIIYLGR